MATMKITLTKREIAQACKEYIVRHFNMSVLDLNTSVTPVLDQRDMPTGEYDLAATATVQQPPGYTGDGKD
jgi:hypothetical protein